MNRQNKYRVIPGGCLHAFLLLSLCAYSVYCQCSSTNLTATESYQELTSPGYPSDYTSDLNCEWYITADNSSNVIQLAFLDLSLERSGLCASDFVALYDGNQSWITYLGRYCGTKIPEEFLSTEDLLTVVFKTDSYKSSRGFKARYISGPVSSFAPSGNDDSSNLSVSEILGSSVGSVTFIVVVATLSVLIYKYIKAKKLTNPITLSRPRRHLPSSRVQPYSNEGNSYMANEAPPAYTEIYNPPLSPPPAYSETYSTR